jgi:hypothetical protein
MIASSLLAVSDTKLRDLCAQSMSYRQVSIALGYTNSGQFGALKQRIKDAGIDVSHFSGKIWNKGLNLRDPQKTLVLHSNKKRISHMRLKICLLKIGREYICERCKQIPLWNNEELHLQIHHINGINYDDRHENLQILCPNCHSQTKSYGRKHTNNTKQQISYTKNIHRHVKNSVHT